MDNNEMNHEKKKCNSNMLSKSAIKPDTDQMEHTHLPLFTIIEIYGHNFFNKYMLKITLFLLYNPFT